jgi:uncharacterized protein with PQ loop repeat
MCDEEHDMSRVMDGIGLAGSALIAASFVPQTIKVVRTGHADGVSPWFMGIVMASSVMMISYGAYFRLVPVVVANVSVGINSAVILFYSLRGERAREDEVVLQRDIL